MRHTRLAALLLLLPLAPGCSEPATIGAIALRLDEAGILDEVDTLVLDVWDAAGLTCRENGELQGTPAGDAIVRDLRLTIGEETTVDVPEGERIFTVTGRAAGERIAVGCVSERLRGGQTVEIEIAVHRLINPGECGNADLEAGEECDDGNTNAGDGCDELCATEEGTFAQSTDAPQVDPAASAGPGGFFAVTWFDTNVSAGAFIKLSFRDERGQRQAGGAGNDRDVNDQVRGDPNAPAVGSSAAGTVVAWEDFSGTGGDIPDVKAHLYGSDTREVDGTDVLPHASVTGRQDQPAAAIGTSGISLVVWRDNQLAPTGIAGRIIEAAGQPAGEVLTISGGQEASAPRVAATSDGFAVAYAGGGVHVRLVAEDGTIGDEIATEAPSSAATPALAVTADGASVLVAWVEQGSVKAQIIRAGATTSAAFAVSAAGSGALPVAAGGDGLFAVAWQAGGDIWARLIDQDGVPVVNRVDDDSTEFRVNRSFDGTQQNVGVAVLGELLLTVWQDEASRPEDEQPSGIRYRTLSIAPVR